MALASVPVKRLKKLFFLRFAPKLSSASAFAYFDNGTDKPAISFPAFIALLIAPLAVVMAVMALIGSIIIIP